MLMASHTMKLLTVCLSMLLAFASSAKLQAQAAYLTGDVSGWGGANSFDASMDSAFGAGNWDRLYFSNVDLGSSLAAHSFLFVDGSCYNTVEFNTFYSAHVAEFESWVTGGGRLFLNVATNQFVNSDLGFGVTTQHAQYSYGGLVLADGSQYSGNYMAHDLIVGDGLTTLIQGDLGATLAYRQWGSGLVAFGGLTEPFFWTTQTSGAPTPIDMLGNQHVYIATSPLGGPAITPVPEPSTYGLMGAGALLGLGAVRRLRRRRQAV